MLAMSSGELTTVAVDLPLVTLNSGSPYALRIMNKKRVEDGRVMADGTCEGKISAALNCYLSSTRSPVRFTS